MSITRGMLVRYWTDDEMTHCGVEVQSPQSVVVEGGMAARVSALLGPDGNPLMVGYERPRMGFDLTPRERKQ